MTRWRAPPPELGPGDLGDEFMTPAPTGARSQWSRDVSGKRAGKGMGMGKSPGKSKDGAGGKAGKAGKAKSVGLGLGLGKAKPASTRKP